MCLTLLVNRVKTLYVFQPSSSFALFPNLAEWILRMFFSNILCIYIFMDIFFFSWILFYALCISRLISIACVSDNDIAASAILLAFTDNSLDNEQ